MGLARSETKEQRYDQARFQPRTHLQSVSLSGWIVGTIIGTQSFRLQTQASIASGDQGGNRRLIVAENGTNL